MNTLSQTRRIALPLSYLTTAALIAYPLAIVILALSGTFDTAFLRESYAVPFPEVLPLPAWIAIYAIAGVSIALTLLILWNVRALLSLFAIGDALSPDVAIRIRRIGALLLATAIYSIIAHTLTIFALTAGNPPGERSLSVAVSNIDLFGLLAAGLMTVIGLAMSEAARIADEHRAFV